MSLNLDTLHLDHGSHRSFESGHCLMEAVAYLAGEKHSDKPACVSPYLRSFGIRLNDRATDEQRQDLIRFIPLVVGTAGDGLDEKRRWMAADHIVHTSLPRLLDRAGLADHAAELRALPVVVDRETWQPARLRIRSARDAAYELRRDRRAKIRADVRAAVEKALGENAVAADVAIAADVAADVAVAAAAAAAADVAADVAVAAAADAAADVAADVAVAAAAAAAAAADVAVAAAIAADVAADDAADVAAAVARYWTIRNKVYEAVCAKLRAAYGERFAVVVAESWDDAVNLYARLIAA